ncbi:MAG: 50S ribosomal protein L2 [bacterium]|nr:50S ribosomal protein L2 [bacterium]
MTKKIRAQRIGNGSPTYAVPSFNWLCEVKYLPYTETTLVGWVKDICHDPGRNAPVACIMLENGEEMWNIAWEGAYVGQKVLLGPEASIDYGNVVPLEKVPEGYPVFNIESLPGDGGKFARASGSYALVVGRTTNRVLVRLPSGKIKEFHPTCRATIGIPAGAGRKEKPFMKAGKKYHYMHARGRKWPRVRGVAMNAKDHPHGGGSHQHEGYPTTVSRRAPPGQKVGHIAARRTGRKK